MIPLPTELKVIDKKGDKATFEISPLCPGYGVTIGNSYRRVLLSSLEGAAITQVKINGVSHEFSTIPGVLEDVIIILLNLKKLRFRSFDAEPQMISLDIKGEKEIKAKDFKLTAQVKLANPQEHIATLTDKKAKLQIEARIEKGIGYVVAEEREEKKAEIGVIPLDAIFTPVKKVTFRIENVIVGKMTDFEKLQIDVETDGTIPPEETFSQATDILVQHFSLFSDFGKKTEAVAEKIKTKKEPKKKPKKTTKKAVKKTAKKTTKKK